MKQNQTWSFFGGVFLACACVMALQILQSRIFSVVTWYHLSFLVISIAMFGLTLGALSIYRGNEEEQRRNLPDLLQKAATKFGIYAVFSICFQIVFPIISSNFKTILLTLPLVAGVTAAAYYCAGQLVSLCLTRSRHSVGLVYGADLAGASAGCLGALLLMQTMDGPSAVLVVAGLAVLSGHLFGLGSGLKNRKNLSLAAILILIGVINAALPKPILYTFWSKGVGMQESSINFEKWNAISRVTVIDGLPNRPVFLWGASPIAPMTKVDYQYLMIDGDASTPITKFDGISWDKLKYLEYDVTNTPYFMPGIENVAIIGVGGGRDLLSARYFGAKNTVALDVNATQVNLLTRHPFYSNYANLDKLPNSRIINSEARNWFTRNQEKFDVIQMSLIDTWAATGAGAFALSENSIYTTDAFNIFLNNLSDHGVLTVSRWQRGEAYNEIGRMLSMTISTLIDRGVKDPRKHIIVTHSGNIATMVAGLNPLTAAQLGAIEKAAKKYQYQVVVAPNVEARNPHLKAISQAKTHDELDKAISNIPYDLSPPGDMRPFFFNQARVLHPIEMFSNLISKSAGNDILGGHMLATINLYIIILFSALVAGLVLILPFKGASKEAPAPFVRAGTAYFGMIGLGFMFVEISLMQIMTMFLGHPVYSLGIVLFSLILSTGFGSLLSERHPLNTPRAIYLWTGMIFVYIAGMALVIDPMIKLFIQEPFAIRVLLCTGLIMPCGLLLGYGFPTGMRMTEAVAPRMTAWFWGINGACGVVASALAVLVGIGWGLDRTLLAGGCLYALLAFPALKLLKFSKT